MIIDDEEHIRSALSCYLEDFDEFRVRSAHSAELALEDLRREAADVCIVDIRLPSMNGAELIRVCQEEGLCRHYLLHTGSADFRLYIDIGKLGMSEADVFEKPCDGMAMLERVRELLRQDVAPDQVPQNVR
jgi:DNA-binding NtrC family response regulator